MTSGYSCSRSTLNRTIFALWCNSSISWTKWDVKALFCFRFSNQLLDQMNIGTAWILRFQNGCYSDKDVFRVTQFWSDISAGRSSDFKITRMIRPNVARHEVQLRSTIILYIYLFSTDLLSGEITMTNGTAYVQ